MPKYRCSCNVGYVVMEPETVNTDLPVLRDAQNIRCHDGVIYCAACGQEIYPKGATQ